MRKLGVRDEQRALTDWFREVQVQIAGRLDANGLVPWLMFCPGVIGPRSTYRECNENNWIVAHCSTPIRAR